MSYADAPIASMPLSRKEKERIVPALRALLKAVGSPGDFGYESKLGIFLKASIDLTKLINEEPDRIPS